MYGLADGQVFAHLCDGRSLLLWLAFLLLSIRSVGAGLFCSVDCFEVGKREGNTFGAACEVVNFEAGEFASGLPEDETHHAVVGFGRNVIGIAV